MACNIAHKPGMVDLPAPSIIEARAAQLGLTMKAVCKRAGIAQSTFVRWKSGVTSPSVDIFRRLLEATAPEPDK